MQPSAQTGSGLLGAEDFNTYSPFKSSLPAGALVTLLVLQQGMGVVPCEKTWAVKVNRSKDNKRDADLIFAGE